MNGGKVGCFFGVVMIAAMASAAWTEDIAAWRGETVTAYVHDHVTLGEAPAGFEVKLGVAREVRYLDRPMGTHYNFAADRVEWGSMAVGPHIVSVTVPATAKPGVYECGDLRIRVIDRVLPPASEWKYHLDLWQHPWSVARFRGVAPFSAAHYAAMRPLWQMLASAGQKALTVTLLDEPWNKQCYDAYHSMIRHIRTSTGWRFDYRIFDEYVAFGRSCGIGPQIACYTMCPWNYQVTWETEQGELRKVRAIPGSAEFAEFWGDFLVDFSAHLKAKGWFADTYLAMDERTPEDVMNIAKFVNAKAPGMKISLAGNLPPSRFKGIEIHNSCFALHKLSDELIAESESRRQRGLVTTYYVCCGPTRPNTMMHNELEEAFWLGVYPAMCGLDGFLRWAWNSWPQDPMNDTSYTGIMGGWRAGDTYLVYPDGSPSLRFLELKNGIQTAEKLRILREAGALPVSFAAVSAKFNRQDALAGKSDWVKLRKAALELVNGK